MSDLKKIRYTDGTTYYGKTDYSNGKDRPCGPGLYYYRDSANVVFAEKFVNYQPHGVFFEIVPSIDSFSVGSYNQGKLQGGHFVCEGLLHSACYSHYDNSQSKDGFCFRFFPNDDKGVLFQYSHGVLLNRCLIISGRGVYFGKCDSEYNYHSVGTCGFLDFNPIFTASEMFGSTYYARNEFYYQDEFCVWDYNSSTYFGQHSDGKANGMGGYVKTDGDKSVGQYDEHRKDGYNLAVFPSGTHFLQKWSCGSRHGLSFENFNNDCFVVRYYQNDVQYGELIKVLPYSFKVEFFKDNSTRTKTVEFPT
ncbi:MAG: hypothetical protein IKC47_04775 [Clostridia bacterium]|nr:hypothetical protein [Clostridia bacterium]